MLGMYGLLDYYQAVREKVGGLQAARKFARVLMIPGVYHCGAGYMPYEEDLLGSIVAWVEAKQPTESVIASAPLPNGSVRERPVFAYPTQTKYAGHGDPDKAGSFVGEEPKAEPQDHYRWLGDSK